MDDYLESEERSKFVRNMYNNEPIDVEMIVEGIDSVISGTIMVTKKIRVSDYIDKIRKLFIAVSNVHINGVHKRVIVVNVSKIIAIIPKEET